MFKFRFHILILFSLFGTALKSQEFQLAGRVTDHGTSLPIPASHVVLEGTEHGSSTDEKGLFSLRMRDLDSFTLRFEHLSYEPRTISYKLADLSSDKEGIYWIPEVQLRQKAFQLPPLQITSERIPDVVYKSATHSIADYEFIGENMLLLAYEKTLNRASKIYLVDDEMKHLDSISVPETVRAKEFVRDYRDRVYLDTRSKLFLIHMSDNESGMRMIKVDKQDFYSQVFPVIDSLAEELYFSTWIDRFPAFDYFGYQVSDSTYSHLHQVADEHMLKMCRAEFKYLTSRDKLKLFRLELETGVEKEVLACISSFDEGLYYEPLYAPMFFWADSMYLFDHPAEKLYVFDQSGQVKDSVEIHYHEPDKVMANHFTNKLIMDEFTGEVYALFQRPGGSCELRNIDKRTGAVRSVIELVYDYPSSIQVRDGEVFYTYRPFESMQKKYLYKEQVILAAGG